MLEIQLSRTRTFVGLLFFAVCAAALVWLRPDPDNPWGVWWTPPFLPARVAMIAASLAFVAGYLLLFVRALVSAPAIVVDQGELTLAFVTTRRLPLSSVVSVSDLPRYVLLRLDTGKTRRVAKLLLRERGDAQRLVSFLAERRLA